MKNKSKLIAVIVIVIVVLIISVQFKRPTYRQVSELTRDMTTKQVIHKLGRLYKDEGSGTIVFVYRLKDNGAAFLTFYEDKLVNVIVKYETGEVKHIIKQAGEE